MDRYELYNSSNLPPCYIGTCYITFISFHLLWGHHSGPNRTPKPSAFAQLPISKPLAACLMTVFRVYVEVQQWCLNNMP